LVPTLVTNTVTMTNEVTTLRWYRNVCIIIIIILIKLCSKHLLMPLLQLLVASCYSPA